MFVWMTKSCGWLTHTHQMGWLIVRFLCSTTRESYFGEPHACIRNQITLPAQQPSTFCVSGVGATSPLTLGFFNTQDSEPIPTRAPK